MQLANFGYKVLPIVVTFIYTVSQKNDTDVAHYNFDADRPILIIFGRDVAVRVCFQTVILSLHQLGELG